MLNSVSFGCAYCEKIGKTWWDHSLYNFHGKVICPEIIKKFDSMQLNLNRLSSNTYTFIHKKLNI